MSDERNRLRNALVYVEFWHALQEGPLTRDELRKVSGMGDHLSKVVLQAMRRRGMVYVAGWRKDAHGRRNTPAYKAGSAPDAPKPAPLSPAARTRAYRQRMALQEM
jgi:hypothetical protein